MENNQDSKETPKTTIMVVEDEDLLLQAISKKLKIKGLGVISCTSAKQAIEYLNNLPKIPNAIWLDYYLGDMDGLEFMNEIKKNDKWARIPVIVVSNSASTQKKNAMLALGVKDYILKAAYRLDDLIEAVKKVAEET